MKPHNNAILIRQSLRKAVLSLMVFSLATSISFADGVIPPMAEPFGYSLDDMAKITADFNISDHSGSIISAPKTPFEFLYTSANNPTNTFSVSHNKFLYVPVVYSNEAQQPSIGNFPDVRSRKAMLSYFFSKTKLGVVYTTIKVDGKINSLGSDYISGIYFTKPLSDGSHGYIVSAAFLNHLSKGNHIVEISVKASGDAVIKAFDSIYESTITYIVNAY